MTDTRAPTKTWTRELPTTKAFREEGLSALVGKKKALFQVMPHRKLLPPTRRKRKLSPERRRCGCCPCMPATHPSSGCLEDRLDRARDTKKESIQAKLSRARTLGTAVTWEGNAAKDIMHREWEDKQAQDALLDEGVPVFIKQSSFIYVKRRLWRKGNSLRIVGLNGHVLSATPANARQFKVNLPERG